MEGLVGAAFIRLKILLLDWPCKEMSAENDTHILTGQHKDILLSSAEADLI